MATTEIIALVETPVNSEKGNRNPMLRAREPIWAGKFFDSEELYGNVTSEKLKLHTNEGIDTSFSFLIIFGLIP